ncbi:MAG: ribonuclease Z [Chloroflexi bacterium]|nr:ribonuclease Z [Chloroflexota bacterium]
MIDALLLGTSGTLPLPDRPLSALLVRVGPQMILFDCGEGTQVSMRRAGWGFKALSAICLSHLHADHVAGLTGLLLTLGHAGRREPLDIFGPVGTRIVVAGLRVVAPYLPYEVRVHELAEQHRIPWNGARLSSLPVDHAVPCLAFRIDLPRSRRFDPEKARTLGVPIEDWKRLQQGETVRVGGTEVTPEQVLGPKRRGLSVAYVTDTRPTPRMPSFLADVDLLTIEGTYGDPADAANAVENKHLLFSEAAEIGLLAGARRVWLTHFSAKMLHPERFAHEATSVYEPTVVGYEGLKTSLRFDDNDA